MLRGVGDRRQSCREDSEQGESVEPQVVHHGFEVEDRCVDRRLAGAAFGEPGAPAVVTHDAGVLDEVLVPVPPLGDLPLALHVAPRRGGGGFTMGTPSIDQKAMLTPSDVVAYWISRLHPAIVHRPAPRSSPPLRIS
jgi:hypothetical protein